MIDLTKKYALRHDPFTEVEGRLHNRGDHFSYPICETDSRMIWTADGSFYDNGPDQNENDLVPLQTRPAAGSAQYYDEDGHLTELALPATPVPTLTLADAAQVPEIAALIEAANDVTGWRYDLPVRVGSECFERLRAALRAISGGET